VTVEPTLTGGRVDGVLTVMGDDLSEAGA